MPVLRDAAAQARAEDRAPRRAAVQDPAPPAAPGVRRQGAAEGQDGPKARTRAKSKPESPRLGRLRTGEIPGIRGDEHGKPWATIVLVALSFGVWFFAVFYAVPDLALQRARRRPVALPDRLAAQRRHRRAVRRRASGSGCSAGCSNAASGRSRSSLLFLLCGPGALAIAVAIDPGALVFGTHGAALGMLCAWVVPVLIARSRSDEDDDADLLGTLVIAAVLLLVPALSQGSAIAGLIGAGLGALAGPRLRRRVRPARR